MTSRTVGLILTVAAAIYAGYVGWIDYDNYLCGDRGAILDAAWNGAEWIDRVC